ncbi:MAG: maleylpyruvate isomerase family mycothiol-dependent enzyme [Actinobacteria bacterium]|nr:maleylpyruvate isomerase family mycothiol-dependent enzyme [Actinomycetota bacterium]
MSDVGEMYAETRERVAELLTGAAEGAADAPVPTCPAWTVHDVLAQVVGVCADILAGRLDGVATDPWTQAQVDARKGTTIAELLAEWAETAPQVEAFADQFPGRAADQWMFDTVTHEHDIRTALAAPGARDSRGLRLGLDFLIAEGFHASVTARGLPAIEVRAGDDAWVVGGPNPAATLTASPFEVCRALSGRRSVHQVRAYEWTGDPDLYLPALTFGPFTPSPTAIVE